ncbi:MAG: bifunctional [glutamate--ammonia ligase]-adenylyl-L-tyrosine phosphorylase/[glutamate--ammonia-ligase] adenylyltransferase, partial [Candidatus Binatia bacterium]
MRNLPKLLKGLPAGQRTKISRCLSESPSPELGRNNFLRLVEETGTKPPRDLAPHDVTALARLLGSSAYLSDVLIRQGGEWPAVFSRLVHATRKSKEDHLAELLPQLNDGTSRAEFARLLRLHKQREMLRIGARDLAPDHSVEETTRELTSLAEAALEASYRFSRSRAERDFGSLSLPGSENPNGFVILGMGKLGGGELNLSSDVDLIYLYESDEGESAGGQKGKKSARDFFSAVAETITGLMGEVTEDGFVFRIDLRLRPLGRHGPIVQSVDSALLYYESWGQCWERSALIKARPVAGDLALGTRFLKDIEPFIYRRYLDFSTVEELREMKARIETELLEPEVRERNVKLGYGGIREIEFFTQALQLVNGGYEPGIRESNTLRALPQLERHGFIPADESERLARAYRFLRDVEHKIQIVHEGQVHTIPKEPEEERSLARRLGYRKKGREDERKLFRRDHRRRTQDVRRAFERLFYSARKEITQEERSSPGEAWHDLDQEELVLEELKKLGFADPRRAYENLLSVRDGTPYSPPSAKRLKIMRALGPALMSEMVKTGVPDTALFNLAEFSHRIGGRTGFLTLLAENPKTMRLLIDLFASSQFLSDVILRRPELIDSLIRVDLTRIRKTKQRMLQELSASLKEAADLEEELDRMRRYRVEEFIRIGLHDLGGELELVELTAQLSQLAEACLEAGVSLAARDTAREWGGLEGARFAILGMGKLGGKEIDYNSDLDLIFVYDAPDEARSRGGKSAGVGAHDYYVRLGQKLVTFLSAPTEEGIAYKIDL